MKYNDKKFSGKNGADRKYSDNKFAGKKLDLEIKDTYEFGDDKKLAMPEFKALWNKD